MDQIIKGFLGVFLIMLLMISSIGILSAFVSVMDAQDFHERVINELEDSNYSRSVIAENFQKAQAAEYQLEVVLYYANGSQAVCAAEAELPSESAGITKVRVNLKYPFCIDFFGVEAMHTLSGYAR